MTIRATSDRIFLRWKANLWSEVDVCTCLAATRCKYVGIVLRGAGWVRINRLLKNSCGEYRFIETLYRLFIGTILDF